MDFDSLTRSMWMGFVLGVTVMFGITIILIPVSYAMNKFIYHGAFMRVILGIIAGVFSVVSFVVLSGLLLAGQLNRVHYFGLMPVITTGDPIEPTGYFAFIMKFIIILIHPLYMFYGQGDDIGYKETIKQCLVSEDAEEKEMTLNGKTVTATKGAVCEEFFAAARAAGSEKDKALWEAKMNELQKSGIGSFIFS